MTQSWQTPLHPHSDAIRDSASIEGLTRTFSRSLTVADIAQPLISLDENQPVVAGLELMNSSGRLVLGVRRAGRVAGWVSRQTLPAEGLLADHFHPFAANEILAETASIQEVLSAMTNRDQIFIQWLGEVAGLVHRADLQKPPVRMWLFGVVTLLDSNLTWAVEQLYPEDSWVALLSAGRLQKARDLQNERRRRHSDCRLIECLQIKDKTDVLMKEATHLKLLGLASHREADRFGREIELLRNHLAHGQELEHQHLDTAGRLAASLDGILRADWASRLVRTQYLKPANSSAQCL